MISWKILQSFDDPSQAKAGFGKIRSKICSYEHSHEERIEEVYAYASVSAAEPLQLFLTDFSSMYVCRVEEVRKAIDGVTAPAYYHALDVER